MQQFIGHVFVFLAHLGGFGLLILGILDSSFLFFPLGNDLLMVSLTAGNHHLMAYYALMAATGSVLGCSITDAIGRKGGEEGLEKTLPKKRLDYVKKKINANAAWALGLASIMPPPFPFTPFVAVAAALQYPRKKLLFVIGVARYTRFLIEGLLAIRFGKGILSLAQNPGVRHAVIVLIAISLAGSALSIYKWSKRRR